MQKGVSVARLKLKTIYSVLQTRDYRQLVAGLQVALHAMVSEEGILPAI